MGCFVDTWRPTFRLMPPPPADTGLPKLPDDCRATGMELCGTTVVHGHVVRIFSEWDLIYRSAFKYMGEAVAPRSFLQSTEINCKKVP